ncbi:hypothetical protein DJ019_02335 [Phenylobacterium kunshanense]|uniref:Uncharacterized protein n=2 Tax=Phenylobacterium kunshanense TaxID=1445034 RepID=A0A328BP50_9CAUL|nr:hypothetical protein DJ019_02335 [Phenylobacterium kunshanense]
MRMRDRFEAEGLPVDLADESERFRAYHEARGTLSASWPASWTTWTLNGLRMARERRAASPQPASPIDWALQGIANR